MTDTPLNSPPPGLTGLERELLCIVEELCSACMNYATQLKPSQTRSIERVSKRLDELNNGVSLVMNSQSALLDALDEFMRESRSFAIIQKELEASRAGLRDAKKALGEQKDR